MIKSLILLDPGPSPSHAILVQPKVEPEGVAYTKMLRQQQLGGGCQLEFVLGLCGFSCLFLARLLCVVTQSSASGVVLLPDIFRRSQTATKLPRLCGVWSLCRLPIKLHAWKYWLEHKPHIFILCFWLREQEPNIVAPPDPLIITGRLLLDLRQTKFKEHEQPTALKQRAAFAKYFLAVNPTFNQEFYTAHIFIATA